MARILIAYMFGSTGVFVNSALVANLSKLGPMYIADSNPGFFSYDQQMLFASRVIVLTGMGQQKTPENKLQGPVPVAEPVSKQGSFEFLFFQKRPNIEKYGNLHLVYTIHYEITHADFVREISPNIQEMINNFDLDLAGFEEGLFDNGRKEYFAKRMRDFHRNLEQIVADTPPKNSIFDISYVTTLNGKKQELAKKLMGAPNGLKISNIQEYSDEVKFFLDQRMVTMDEDQQIIKGR